MSDRGGNKIAIQNIGVDSACRARFRNVRLIDDDHLIDVGGNRLDAAVGVRALQQIAAWQHFDDDAGAVGLFLPNNLIAADHAADALASGAADESAVFRFDIVVLAARDHNQAARTCLQRCLVGI